MFKTRSGGQGKTSPASPPSIEAVRRRARHRLIGASVLVLAGVIGFPILFDTQPRPIAIDLPIDIPGRQSAKPLAIPPSVQVAPSEGTTPAAPTVAQVAPPTPAPVPAKTPAAMITETASGDVVSDKAADHKPADKAPPKTADKPTDKPVAKATDKAVDKPTTKVVVQVGAFAEADRAREVRQRLERAGLKTYTHVADTPQGKRIRVRVGPFETKAEADKAALKVKGLGLPAAVLTL
ncbi:MAG: hypothetical protein RJA09_38 [Pseudomonadota bacterium]|jgi:DedD protein